jgi:hypothetical protein
VANKVSFVSSNTNKSVAVYKKVLLYFYWDYVVCKIPVIFIVGRLMRKQIFVFSGCMTTVMGGTCYLEFAVFAQNTTGHSMLGYIYMWLFGSFYSTGILRNEK